MFVFFLFSAVIRNKKTGKNARFPVLSSLSVCYLLFICWDAVIILILITSSFLSSTCHFCSRVLPSHFYRFRFMLLLFHFTLPVFAKGHADTPACLDLFDFPLSVFPVLSSSLSSEAALSFNSLSFKFNCILKSLPCLSPISVGVHHLFSLSFDLLASVFAWKTHPETSYCLTISLWERWGDVWPPSANKWTLLIHTTSVCLGFTAHSYFL